MKSLSFMAITGEAIVDAVALYVRPVGRVRERLRWMLSSYQRSAPAMSHPLPMEGPTVTSSADTGALGVLAPAVEACTIVIHALDGPGLLAAVGAAMAESRWNITALRQTFSNDHRVVAIIVEATPGASTVPELLDRMGARLLAAGFEGSRWRTESDAHGPSADEGPDAAIAAIATDSLVLRRLKRLRKQADALDSRVLRAEQLARAGREIDVTRRHVVKLLSETADRAAGLQASLHATTVASEKPRGSVLSLAALAMLLTTIGAVAEYFVNSSTMPTISSTVWWVVSPLISLAIAAISHVVATVATWRGDVGVRVQRRLVNVAYLSILVSPLGGIVLGILQTAPWFTHDFKAAASALVVFAVATALPISGGLFAAAATLESLRRSARRLEGLQGDRLTVELATLDAYRAWLDRAAVQARMTAAMGAQRH